MTTKTPAETTPVDRELLDALEELTAVLADRTIVDQALARAERIREKCADAGCSYRDLISEDQRPLLVELVSDRLEQIAAAGARFRRAEAAGLHAEGMTMEQIAEAFGVSRQRVSTILREAAAGGT